LIISLQEFVSRMGAGRSNHKIKMAGRKHQTFALAATAGRPNNRPLFLHQGEKYSSFSAGVNARSCGLKQRSAAKVDDPALAGDNSTASLQLEKS